MKKKILLAGILHSFFSVWSIPLSPDIPLQALKETLPIQDDCSIAGQSYADLIHHQHCRNKPFILARTTTIVNNKKVVHYFEGENLNKWVFNGKPYGTILLKPNPLNWQPIINLQYFILEPEGTQLCFLGSYKQFNDPIFKHHFENYSSAPHNDLDTARAYFYGQKNVKKDYERALFFYKLAARQDHNMKVQAKAHMKLFTMYMNGLGTSPNPSRGMRHIEKAAEQNADLATKALAHLEIGKELLKGDKVDQDYELARQRLQYAFSQEHNKNAKASAAFYLGELFVRFYNNIPHAIHYYTYASEQPENKKAKAHADAALTELSILDLQFLAACKHFCAFMPNILHADIKERTLTKLREAPRPKKMLQEFLDKKLTTWENL